MSVPGTFRGRILLWSALAFTGFLVIAVVIPLVIRSVRLNSQPERTTASDIVMQNATKLAVEATAAAFPAAEVGAMDIKPLGENEAAQTPEATAYAPVLGAQAAGAGAIVEVQPPFPASLYRIQNAWLYDDEQGTRRTFAWAGSETRQGEPEPGVIIIQVYVKGSNDLEPQTEVYPAPEGIGPLKVISAEGMRLSLESAQGQVVLFDIAERLYLTE